ncbi:MAG: hypothetical protein RLY69_347 [Verrucomicrobiota bacterium]
MRHFFHLLIVTAFASVVLSSCAGYRLGVNKPAALAGVKNIHVPMFSNQSFHPRAEALATSAVVNAFTTDGTYRITGLDEADAVLEGRVTSIEYTQLVGNRLDTALPEQLRNSVTLNWELKDSRDRGKVLMAGSSVGTSQLFVTSNLQTSRNNALPEAVERAGEVMVSRLSSSY